MKINNRVFNLVLGLGLDFVALQDLDFGGGHLDGDRLGRGSGVVAMAAGWVHELLDKLIFLNDGLTCF